MLKLQIIKIGWRIKNYVGNSDDQKEGTSIDQFSLCPDKGNLKS